MKKTLLFILLFLTAWSHFGFAEDAAYLEAQRQQRRADPKDIYIAVYGSPSGGNACTSGHLLGLIDATYNDDFQLVRDSGIPYDIHLYGLPGRDVQAVNRDISTLEASPNSGANKAKYMQRLRGEIFDILRGDKASLCAEILKGGYSRDDAAAKNLGPATGKLWGMLDSASGSDSLGGLRLRIQNSEVEIIQLHACCNASRECTGVLPISENCPAGSGSLGPVTNRAMCATSPIPDIPEQEPEEDAGGCCLNGKCYNISAENCGMRNGVYLPEGEPCSAESCRKRTGACVTRTDCLSWRTEEDCGMLFGRYLPGEPCFEQDEGNCVDDSGKCSQQPHSLCVHMGWTWLGDEPCPAKKGACCAGDGTCSLTTREACTGNFNEGAETCEAVTCAQPGACCTPDGCKIMQESECPAGRPFKPGVTSCDIDPCQGTCYMACPFNDERYCKLTDKKLCEGLKGSFDPNELECPLKGDALTLDEPFCESTDCDRVVGIWQRDYDGKLMSLNARKKAVLFDPEKNKFIYGEYDCDGDCEKYPPTSIVRVDWKKGKDETFKLMRDTPRGTEILCFAKDDSQCASKQVFPDEGLRKILTNKVRKESRLEYYPDYYWPVAEPYRSSCKFEYPPRVHMLVRLSGKGYVPAGPDDASEAWLLEGDLVTSFAVDKGTDPGAALKTFLKSFAKIDLDDPASFSRQCFPKSGSGTKTSTGLPDIYSELKIETIPNAFQSNGVFEDYYDLQRTEEKLKLKRGNHWKHDGSPVKSPYGFCE